MHGSRKKEKNMKYDRKKLDLERKKRRKTICSEKKQNNKRRKTIPRGVRWKDKPEIYKK